MIKKAKISRVRVPLSWKYYTYEHSVIIISIYVEWSSTLESCFSMKCRFCVVLFFKSGIKLYFSVESCLEKVTLYKWINVTGQSSVTNCTYASVCA
jgi:hypothetical protein